MRILGIDPGLRITGFGVLEKQGQKLVYVTSGCIRTDNALGLPMRLKTILDGLHEVIDGSAPEQVAVEKVFGVKVASVNTLNRQGKRKRTKGGFGKRADSKRAIVTLREGRIEIFGGPVA